MGCQSITRKQKCLIKKQKLDYNHYYASACHTRRLQVKINIRPFSTRQGNLNPRKKNLQKYLTNNKKEQTVKEKAIIFRSVEA